MIYVCNHFESVSLDTKFEIPEDPPDLKPGEWKSFSISTSMMFLRCDEPATHHYLVDERPIATHRCEEHSFKTEPTDYQEISESEAVVRDVMYA